LYVFSESGNAGAVMPLDLAVGLWMVRAGQDVAQAVCFEVTRDGVCQHAPAGRQIHEPDIRAPVATG